MQTIARRLPLLAAVLAFAVAGLWWWSTRSHQQQAAHQIPPLGPQEAGSSPSAAGMADHDRSPSVMAGSSWPAIAESGSIRASTAATAQASYREARHALHERDLYRSYVKLHDAHVPGSTLAAHLLMGECKTAWLSAKLPHPRDSTTAPGVLDPVTREDATLRSLRLAAQQEVQTRCKPLMDDSARWNTPGDDPYAPRLSDRARNLSPSERYELAVRSGDALYVLGVLREPKGAAPLFEGQPFGGAHRDVFNRALDLARLRHGWDPQATTPSLGTLALCAEQGRCGANPEQVLNDDGFPPFSDPAVQDLARRLQAALERGDAEAFLKGNVKASQP